jgi:hypothetical protein
MIAYSVSAETRYENCLPIDDVCLCCTSWIVVKLQSTSTTNIFLDSVTQVEKSARNMHSLARYSEPIKSIRNGSNVI